MSELFTILGGYVLLTASILQIGRLLLRRAPAMGNSAYLVLSWVLGSAAFSLAVLFLAATHSISRFSLAALCIACLLSGGRARLPRMSLQMSLPAAITILFLGVHFITSLSPSDDSDGYRYHLGFQHLYRNTGGIFPIPEDFYASFPQGAEMLYLSALEFGGFAVANLLHWNFLVALVLAMYATGANRDSVVPARYAAAAICVAPVVGSTVAAAGVDFTLAAAFWLCFHCLLEWRGNGHQFWLYATAACAGICCGIKYTGITAVAMVAVCAWKMSAPLSQAIVAATIAAVPVVPWLIRNWVFVSNPVHPFLNSVFPNPHLLPSSEAAWIANVRSYEGLAFNAGYFYEATIRGVTTMGFAGPFFLLTPIALLALASPFGRWLLVGGLFAAIPWIFGNPVLRFAVPALPFLAFAITVGLMRVPAWSLPAVLCIHALMCFPPFIERWNKQPQVAWKEIPWRRALRMESPESYWQQLPTYSALRYLDEHSPPDSRVIAFDEQYQFFTTRLLANPYASEHSSLAVEMLNRTNSPDTQPSLRCSARVDADVTHLRLLQQDRNGDPWTIHELSLPAGATLTSSHNAFDLNLAVDGNDVTAWSSKVPRHEAMWIDVRWPTTTHVSTLSLLSSPLNNGALTISFDGKNPVPFKDCRNEPPDRFEHRTIREIRRRGWTHLLATREYPWLKAMTTTPDRFGVKLVYQNGRARLIELR